MVKVINEKPYFISKISPIKLFVGQVQDYQLPEVGDRENLQVKISFDYLPRFITISNNKVMTVAPLDDKDIGNYNIKITLEDAGKARREYVMLVTV